MSTATLSGNSLTRARLFMPSTGVWFADVECERAVALAGMVTLVIAGLSLVGHVYRGETYQGSAAYRIEGGFGGWRLPIRARSHQDDSQVRLSRVLAGAVSDMPAVSAEMLVVDPSADRKLGTHWMRPAGLASVSLSLLTTPWWLRADGSTFAGPRATGQVADTRADVLGFDPERRRLTIGTETPELWTPGLTFTSSRLTSPVLVREVTVLAGESSLRVEVLG